ncbi:MAG: cell division protein ZapA [Bacillota bacterium]|nr:cell division protein ZapA [Bacillota bacterium]
MTVKNKVEVRIAGKIYTLMGVESDEYIQRIGLYIDKKMAEVMRVNNSLSTSMAAILTAINVADDYYKTQESESHHKKELKRISDELEKLKDERKRLIEENSVLSTRNTGMQLELAKREAELNEVRNSLSKASRHIV